MNVKIRRILVGVGALALATGVSAQQQRTAPTARASTYTTSREAVVQGTVVNYTENSGRAPLGAHVTVETPSGPREVQLGPVSYLHANNFSLAPGDTVRFVGASVTVNKENVFLARIAQKGNQIVTIRSPQGFPLASRAGRTLSEAERAAAQQERPR